MLLCSYGRKEEGDNSRTESEADGDDAMDTTADVLGHNDAVKPSQMSPQGAAASHVTTLCSVEAAQVKDFVTLLQQNCGVVHLLGEWCMAVAGQALCKWLVT